MREWAGHLSTLDGSNENPILPTPTQQALAGFVSRYPQALQCLLDEADDIQNGRFRKFEGEALNLGFPPSWNEEIPGQSHQSRGIHWSHIRPVEDLKLVWELNRMGWAQILSRAYAFTGQETYAEAFWTLLEDWRRENPPNQGPQWMCGQEIAIRTIALALSDGLLKSAKASTPLRRAQLREVIHVSAQRIKPHFHYARSQRNNHSLNEALGLMTAAVLSHFSPVSMGWLREGTSCFAEDLLDQLDHEGSYIQHSTVYHRVMLHACTWRLVLAQTIQAPLEDGLAERMEAGLRWMVAMVDPQTGQSPNLGSNDGANVLRLASSPFHDYRPAIQGLAAMLGLPLPYPPGPWDEPILWLQGQDPESLPRQTFPRQELTAPKRGHFLRLFKEGSLYFRCATYMERPSQSDPLHVDLTWRGINVLCDAGTYRYNARPPWMNSLAFTGVHNTVTLDGRPSMQRIGPFLWLDWDEATYLPGATSGWLVGERQPNRVSPMIHRRSVALCGPSHWIIVDDVSSQSAQPLRLHWLLPSLPFTTTAQGVDLATPEGLFQVVILGPGSHSCTKGDPDQAAFLGPQPPPGVRSTCYSQIESAIALTRLCLGDRQVRWITVVGGGPFTAHLNSCQISLHSPDGQFQIELPPIPYKEQ
jgi:hypothetical protein